MPSPLPGHRGDQPAQHPRWHEDYVRCSNFSLPLWRASSFVEDTQGYDGMGESDNQHVRDSEPTETVSLVASGGARRFLTGLPGAFTKWQGHCSSSALFLPTHPPPREDGRQ